LKIPIDVSSKGDTCVCNIKKNSDLAKLLIECDFIVWDEITMIHKYALHALDRTLRDIRNDQRPMGGLVILFTGDFCQTLPVVPRGNLEKNDKLLLYFIHYWSNCVCILGTRGDTVRSCIKFSNLWPNIIQLPPLTKNMRLKDESELYNERLRQIGRGRK